MAKKPSIYHQIIEAIFQRHFTPGAASVPFSRDELNTTADALRVERPKNLGDLIYTFRFRKELPESIRAAAPENMTWIIRMGGHSTYRFTLIPQASANVKPAPGLEVIEMPDATPSLINRYALSDEQALLAKLRYNRLIDAFTGLSCYSLQNHLKTQVKGMGQVETDEIYVGVDADGERYVLPVQAKGGKDIIGFVQIEQDIALCAGMFSDLRCRPIAAQFMPGNVIALFELHIAGDTLTRVREKHYRLVALPERKAPPKQKEDPQEALFCEQ